MNPMHFLKLEWQKFSPNTTFRILSVLYVIFFGLGVWLAFLIGRNLEIDNNGEMIRPAADLFTFPRSWELVAYAGSWMNMILLGFTGVFMVTLELSNRTLRQNIISGLNRWDLFLCKFTGLIAISALATLCYLFFGALAGFSESSNYNPAAALPPAGTVVCYFLQCLGYLLMGTLSGLYIRQTALATLAYLAYVLFIERIFYWILYLSLVKSSVFPVLADILLLLPNKVLSALAPFPVPQMALQMTGQQKIFEGLSEAGVWIAALAYIVLFTFLFFRRLRKADF